MANFPSISPNQTKFFFAICLPSPSWVRSHAPSIRSHRGSQKNRFALIYFGKIQFLPPSIWNIPFMSYLLGRVPVIKVMRGILDQKSPTVLLMWLLNINSSIWHLQDANSPIVNGKGNIYSANFDTFQVYLPDVRPEPAYEHCATIWPLYIMCSKYVPALLWKLYMKIFNTLSILHLVLFYLQLKIYFFVLNHYLYCIILYCIVYYTTVKIVFAFCLDSN